MELLINVTFYIIISLYNKKNIKPGTSTRFVLVKPKSKNI